MKTNERLVEDLITLYSGIDDDDLSYMVDYYVENIISDGGYNVDAYDDNGDILDELKDDAFGWLVNITADYITTNLSIPTHKAPQQLNHKWYIGDWDYSPSENKQINTRGIVGYYIHICNDLSPILSFIREQKINHIFS
jgi:hypothetical protein